MTPRPPSWITKFFNGKNLLLIVLGVAATILYRISLRAHVGNDIIWFLKLALIQAIIFVAATITVLRTKTSSATFVIVVGFAVLFRLSLLFSPPYLSDDIYRYVWDGRVQAAGVNPYRYVPADPALAQLQDQTIYPHINRRDYAHTIYPPLSEAVFLLTTRISESVTWMKTTMIFFEALAVWAIVELLAILGLPRQRVLLYAWHPLAVWEFAGSGHADAIAIGCIGLALLARQRRSKIGTGLSLGGSILGKSFPLVLAPAFYERWDWKMPLTLLLTIVIGYAPYLGVGPAKAMVFLFGSAPERGIESGEEFFILSAVRNLFGLHVSTAAYVGLALLVGAATVSWILREQARGRDDNIKHGLIVASVFLVLVSPHFPWYFAWIIPFLCFVPSPAVIYMTLASYLLYLTWLGDAPNQVLKMKSGIFLPALAVLVITMLVRRLFVGNPVTRTNESEFSEEA